MKIRIAFLLALLCALHSPPGDAATYYVANCQTGTGFTPAGGCTNGSDASGTPTNLLTPWQTFSKVATFFNTSGAGGVQCGDKFLFAKGGVWTNFGGAFLDAPNARAGQGCALNPIIFDSYDPTIWTSAAQPVLQECRADTNGINFSENGSVGSNNHVDGGYVVQNLRIDGCRTAFGTLGVGAGVQVARSAHDVTVRNNTITRWQVGIGSYEDANEKTSNCKFQNNTIDDNTEQGFLVSCDNSLTEGNAVTDTAAGCPHLTAQCDRYHNYYFSGFNGYRYVIRNNTSARNTIDDTGVCSAVALVFHGHADQLDIYGNTFQEAAGAQNSGCWFIAVDGSYDASYGPEGFTRVKVWDNVLRNCGGVCIGIQAAPNVEIYNNMMIQEAGVTGFSAISLPVLRDLDNIDAKDTGAKILYNSLYAIGTPNGMTFIDLSDQTNVNPGTNLQVAGNLAYFGTAGSSFSCYNFGTRVLSNFTVWNNNGCYRASGGNYSSAYATIANAQSAGFDVNGSAASFTVTAPSGGNGYKMKLTAANNLGNATYKLAHDGENCTRGATNDAGAYPYRASGCTPAPQPVGFQRIPVGP